MWFIWTMYANNFKEEGCWWSNISLLAYIFNVSLFSQGWLFLTKVWNYCHLLHPPLLRQQEVLCHLNSNQSLYKFQSLVSTIQVFKTTFIFFFLIYQNLHFLHLIIPVKKTVKCVVGNKIKDGMEVVKIGGKPSKEHSRDSQSPQPSIVTR